MVPKKVKTEIEFAQRIFKAKDEYQIQFGGVDTPWSNKDRNRFAEIAARKVELAFPDGTVDPKIVEAIRTFANDKKDDAEHIHAIDTAWKAYKKHWPTVH